MNTVAESGPTPAPRTWCTADWWRWHRLRWCKQTKTRRSLWYTPPRAGTAPGQIRPLPGWRPYVVSGYPCWWYQRCRQTLPREKRQVLRTTHRWCIPDRVGRCWASRTRRRWRWWLVLSCQWRAAVVPSCGQYNRYRSPRRTLAEHMGPRRWLSRQSWTWRHRRQPEDTKYTQ